MRAYSLLTGLLLLVATTAGASTPQTRQLAEDQVSPPATLADVAWIAGPWQGEAFGGVAEESWSEPAGGSMMSMFRLIVGGEVRFYELQIIREVEQTLIMQLKHFHADLKGWEEREETVDFPLVEVTGNAVFFAGLTFERTGPDSMTVWVLIDDKEGKAEVPFHYRRP